jgi:hypothetical protein
VAHTRDSVPKHAAARGQWLRDTRAGSRTPIPGCKRRDQNPTLSANVRWPAVSFRLQASEPSHAKVVHCFDRRRFSEGGSAKGTTISSVPDAPRGFGWLV